MSVERRERRKVEAMRPEGPEAPPPRVHCVRQAKQGGERPSRWDWTEPSVWTNRMLAALENGVKGGVWFSLIDKVYAEGNLATAYRRVRQNGGAAGVDHITVQHYGNDLEANLNRLHEELKAGRYRPQAVRRQWIPKPGKPGEERPLGIPTVHDRVAQTALRNVLEPIYEGEFAEHSYGFRPNRGCKDALRRVDQLFKAGYRYVVDADIKGYFDHIPHERLMQRVQERVADSRVLELVERYLKQGVLDGAKQWTPEEGTPQGAVISPLLANIYLNPLDHIMAQRGYEMVRYADDFVILCRTEEQAHEALRVVEEWMQANGLTLHPEKTRIVDGNREGFDFLGYHFHFRNNKKWPSRKSTRQFKDHIRPKTKRANGCSMSELIGKLNPILRGWFEYFKHTSRQDMSHADGYVRDRLRAILRKRRRRRGRASQPDRQRWNNHYFLQLGLFSLEEAYNAACQSSTR